MLSMTMHVVSSVKTKRGTYMENARQKPVEEIVTGNHNKRFSPVYKCYCPKCNNLLKRDNDKCSCGQEIDWSEWQ